MAGQIGLEQSSAEYVAAMVAVFREMRRILRDDGTLWCNLGDAFGPNKQLQMIPARVALALQADGWVLRSDVIWAKPNPMPESVTDRPTRSHEYIFLLSKAARYYYDAEAIAEPVSASSDFGKPRPITPMSSSIGPHRARLGNGSVGSATGRNKRDVWTVATAPYPNAHFATFPPKLIEPCILAGTSAKGACPACGAPWRRIVEKSASPHDGHTASAYATGSNGNRISLARQAARERGGEYASATVTLAWEPSCTCGRTDTVPCTVLDIFAGAGTTLLVAKNHNRQAVGIELNESYCRLIVDRLAQDVLPLEVLHDR